MRTRIVCGIAVALALALPASALAQEHPTEHPTAKKGVHQGVTKEALADAIAAYIQGEMKKGGGAWKIEDPETGDMLALTLEKVHRDKLAQTAPDTYFACADLSGADGHTYDLDVYMKGSDAGHLEVTDVTVHKKDGKARYAWEKKGDVWVKKPVEESKK